MALNLKRFLPPLHLLLFFLVPLACREEDKPKPGDHPKDPPAIVTSGGENTPGAGAASGDPGAGGKELTPEERKELIEEFKKERSFEGRTEEGQLKPEDFLLIVMENMASYAHFKADGPDPHAYIGRELKNRAAFESDGNLVVDVLDNGGQLDVKETVTGVPQQLQLRQGPPSIEEFTAGRRVIRFSSDARVEELDETGHVVSTSTGKFFTDPSGATWMYKGHRGSHSAKDAWALKGDIPSTIEGYSLVFETDLRNPNKTLDVFDGGIYVKGDFSDNGVLTIREKPDKFALVVLGNAFHRNRAEIVGKVHVGGNMKLVGEDEEGEEPEDEEDEGEPTGGDGSGAASSGGGPGGKGEDGQKGKPEDPGAQGQGKGKDECPGNSCNAGAGGQKGKKQAPASPQPFVEVQGSLFVGGNIDSHVFFQLTNAALTQQVADAAIVNELPGGENLEWVGTTLFSDPDALEPAVAINAYRVPPEISLAPPMSRVAPRKTSLGTTRSIHELRAMYRKAERGHTNPVVGELSEEELVTFVTGNSLNYGVFIALYGGVPAHLIGLNETLKRFQAAGQNAEVLSFSFIPTANFVGQFMIDGQPRHILLDPLDPGIAEATRAQIDEMMAQVEVFRANEEGRMFREIDWQEHILLARESTASGGSLPAPRRASYVDTADGTFVESELVRQYHAGKKPAEPPWVLLTDYPESKVQWAFTQSSTDWSCGPTTASQLMTFWRVDRGKYCIDPDPRHLADRLADWMHTGTVDDNPTMPWAADEGIEGKAWSDGYITNGEWQEISPEGDVRDHVLHGEPSMWVTAFAGGQDPIHGKTEKWHYRLIVGYQRIAKTWPKPNEWYFMMIDNREKNPLQKRSVSWWSVWGAGWSAVTVNTLTERYTYYLDGDHDGYGDLNSPAKFCDSSPPRPDGGGTYWASIIFPDCESGETCLPPEGVDCNDGDPAICPNSSQCRERCNGVDDDCDGGVDESIPDRVTDPHGSDDVGECRRQIERCQNGQFEIIQDAIAPQPETCDGKDNDCDGQIDDGVKVTAYFDLDGDGYGGTASFQVCPPLPPLTSSQTGDCNDLDKNVRPGLAESCDNKDNNCNGQVDEGVVKPTWWRDADGDGYGNAGKPTQACGQPGGYVSNPDDCNDGSWSIKPGASETCNGADDNCNGSVDEGLGSTWYQDSDGDGYGYWFNTKWDCSQPGGYVSNALDCNDSNAAVYPRCPSGYAYWYSNICSRWPVDSDCGNCGGYLGKSCNDRRSEGCWYDSTDKACRYRDNGSCNDDCGNVNCPAGWTRMSCDPDGIGCGATCTLDNPSTVLCGKGVDCGFGAGWNSTYGVCTKTTVCN